MRGSEIHETRGQPDSPIEYASLSDIGLQRSSNQDSCGVFPTDSSSVFRPKGQLFIIADGIGGLIGGRTASEMAVHIIQEAYFADESPDIPQSLLNAFNKANTQICEELSCVDPFSKMGTTCSALVLTRERGSIAHVGDSRIFLIWKDEIIQLTWDHTITNELLRHGAITEDEAQKHPEKGILSRALGVESEVEIDIVDTIPLQKKQRFILCTDGIKNVSPDEIRDVVLSESPEQACRTLVQMANERGGADNITVQVIQINQP